MGILGFLRRRRDPPSRVGDVHRVPAVVFARLTEDTLRVTLFPGSGMADGGIPRDLPLDLVPPALRLPNTELELVIEDGEVREVLPRP